MMLLCLAFVLTVVSMCRIAPGDEKPPGPMPPPFCPTLKRDPPRKQLWYPARPFRVIQLLEQLQEAAGFRHGMLSSCHRKAAPASL